MLAYLLLHGLAGVSLAALEGPRLLGALLGEAAVVALLLGLFLSVRVRHPYMMESSQAEGTLECRRCRLRFCTEQTRHCSICDQCVTGFDHHCRYMDLCIGENNYRLFIGLMLAALLDAGYNIVLGLACYALGLPPLRSLQANWLHLLTAGLFSVPALAEMGLLLFHGYLACHGITTY